jgi:uncharacterized protein YfdQ (DUF2303 family)
MDTAVPALDLKLVADLGRDATRATLVTLEFDPDTIADTGLPGSVPSAWDPKTGKFVDLKPLFEAWRSRPARRRGTAKAQTLDSFIGLVQRLKTFDTVVFADTDWRKPSLTAVIDWHPPGDAQDPAGDALAGNAGHRVHYTFPLSESWAAWVASNGVTMSQADFAAFLEDHITDLSSPGAGEAADLERDYRTSVATPSRLIDLSRGLQVHVEAKVRNIVNLQSGVAQIAFEEQHKDGDGKPIEVPGLFILQVPPFYRGGVVRMPVRLRYRMSGGKIVWFYQMIRPDLAITDRVMTDLDQVSAATGLQAFEGCPET